MFMLTQLSTDNHVMISWLVIFWRQCAVQLDLMAAPVNLSLSAEQAALLLPILEQISSGVSATQVPQHSLSTSSSSSSGGTSSDHYSADELLQRKKKNSKSTTAQGYLLVS